MNITLCSTFRNSAPYLARYFNQINALDHALHMLGHRLSLIWGEGDSTDGTLKLLQAATYRFRAKLVDVTHGGPRWASIEHPERFKQLAQIANKVWDEIPGDADAMVWAESDLIWEPATISGLIDRLAEYPCVSALVLEAPPSQLYYDVFVHRRNGQRFTKQPPYHPDIAGAGAMLQMDSAGSVIAMRGDVARAVRVPPADVLIGTCRQIYENGGSVWIDLTLPPVYHP